MKASSGDRNNPLFKSSAECWRPAFAGLILEHEVQISLKAAATQSGLRSDEIQAIIHSAKYAARKKPINLEFLEQTFLNKKSGCVAFTVPMNIVFSPTSEESTFRHFTLH